MSSIVVYLDKKRCGDLINFEHMFESCTRNTKFKPNPIVQLDLKLLRALAEKER